MKTASQLITDLRNRLNDGLSGRYTDTELLGCINTGLTEIEILTGCTTVVASVTVADSAREIDITASNIFRPIAVIGLDRVNLLTLTTTYPDWPTAVKSTPKVWCYETGKKLLIHPKPTGSVTFTVIGKGVSAPLTSSDSPVTLPPGFDTNALLDRAELEARKLRASFDNNAALIPVLTQVWAGWIDTMKNNASEVSG